LASVLLAAGCSEEITTSSGAPAGSGAVVSRSPTAATSSSASASADAGPPKIDFQEVEFGESERSRDPFRSYATAFVDEARSQIRSQREVVLDQYSIDDLKLAAIVTGVEPARAMIIDPAGMGHIIVRGQFVGKPETVQGAGQSSAAYEVNWRVDRIRDGDIVLVREDPTNPDVPSATRVIPLHPEGEQTK